MGRKSKYGFALSWADEVAKEEEEAAQTQEHQTQKTNPFGPEKLFSRNEALTGENSTKIYNPPLT